MPAVASTIFKIKAIADYVSPSPQLLSFRKGQPFYALAADHERGVYFVSTQFATPFARTAVSGIVPLSYFVQVDLHAKDPQPAANASNASNSQNSQNASNASNAAHATVQPAAQAAAAAPTTTTTTSNSKNAVLPPEWTAAAHSRIVAVEVLSAASPATATAAAPDLAFCIKVIRESCSHSILRSVADLVALHRSCTIHYAATIAALPDLPILAVSPDLLASQAIAAQVEHYLNILVALESRVIRRSSHSSLLANATAFGSSQPIPSAISLFFHARDDKELASIRLHPTLRRDSGVSEAYIDKDFPSKFDPRSRSSSMSSISSSSSFASNNAAGIPAATNASVIANSLYSTHITAPIPAAARKDVIASWTNDTLAIQQQQNGIYAQRVQSMYINNPHDQLHQSGLPVRHAIIPGHGHSTDASSTFDNPALAQHDQSMSSSTPQRKRSIASDFFHQLFGSNSSATIPTANTYRSR